MVSARPRDGSGQFVGRTIPTEDSLRMKAIRKQRQARNKATGSRLFDEYVDSTFLEGEEKDWLMADSQLGPLATVPILLLKTSFLPTSKERCERVRKRYFEYQTMTKQDDIKQEYILDGNNLDGRKRRRRIFRGRRLPKLGSEEEMKKMWDFIDNGLQCNAFKVSTKEEAYEIIRKAFLSYKEHKNSMYYEGYPPPLSEQSRNREATNPQMRQPLSDITNANSTGTTATEIIEVSRENTSSGCPPGSSPGGAEGEEQAYVSTVCQLFTIARNDRMFYFLCRIAEDMRDSRLNCVATALLQMHGEGTLKCHPVMLDALRYARLRQNGGHNSDAFRAQQSRVQVNAEMLKLIRNTYMNLSAYEDMHLSELPLIRQTAQTTHFPPAE